MTHRDDAGTKQTTANLVLTHALLELRLLYVILRVGGAKPGGWNSTPISAARRAFSLSLSLSLSRVLSLARSLFLFFSFARSLEAPLTRLRLDSAFQFLLTTRGIAIVFRMLPCMHHCTVFVTL